MSKLWEPKLKIARVNLGSRLPCGVPVAVDEDTHRLLDAFAAFMEERFGEKYDIDAGELIGHALAPFFKKADFQDWARENRPGLNLPKSRSQETKRRKGLVVAS